MVRSFEMPSQPRRTSRIPAKNRWKKGGYSEGHLLRKWLKRTLYWTGVEKLLAP